MISLNVKRPPSPYHPSNLLWSREWAKRITHIKNGAGIPVSGKVLGKGPRFSLSRSNMSPTALGAWHEWHRRHVLKRFIRRSCRSFQAAFLALPWVATSFCIGPCGASRLEVQIVPADRPPHTDLSIKAFFGNTTLIEPSLLFCKSLASPLTRIGMRW